MAFTVLRWNETWFQGKAGFPRSWKILEKIAVMESHGKVLEYENFPKSLGKVMELLVVMAMAAF